MNRNILITGSNRGIGLALTQHYLNNGDTVYAVCRKASKELVQLKGIHIIEGIDVTQDNDLLILKESLGTITLDILINNAGIMSEEVLGNIDFLAIEHQFKVNAIGPLKTTETLLDHLSAGAKVALVSTRMGSISDNGSGGFYGYRMSKTALNSAGKTLAQDLKPKGISVAMLHPGFVQTDLVNNAGDVTPTQAAEGLVQRIEELTLQTSGTFWHANGEVLPW